MLRELHIHNLAVIEDATIELRPGLNGFTGQTGAGKSLIIGAFGVLLGLRSAGELLREGAEEGRVSGVFELDDPDLIRRIGELADLDLETHAADGDDRGGGDEGGGQILITRKLFASGRSSVSINGRPATMGMLRELGELLVDVHGQHDHQFLLKPGNQLLLLDGFARTQSLRDRFAQLHAQLREWRDRKQQLEASRNLRRQQLELYEFQAAEIDDAAPVEGEDEQLEARHRLLSNVEKLKRETGQASDALYEADGAVIERLQAVLGVIRSLTEVDEDLEPIAEQLYSAAAQLQDASFSLSRYNNRLDLDPAELEEIEQRLNTLNRLIQKYGSMSPGADTRGAGGAGGALEHVLSYRERIEGEMTRLRRESEDLESIEQRIASLREQLSEIGAELSDKRKEAAEQLRPRVEAQLAELGMAEATLEVTFQTPELEAGDGGGETGPTGLDAIEMLVRANPGQSARPLRKVASGGELSRIMLALKSILARADRISVLVFDEVDANIGGRLGTVIGEKLNALASDHQILCITHLPQIAAFADHHLRIVKSIEQGQTRTTVAPLEGDQRVDELAEMLTGHHASTTTREQAKEMLKLARKKGSQIVSSA